MINIEVFLEGSQAVAEAQKVDRSLDGIGKAAQSGAGQAKAAMSGLEKAAGGTALNLEQLRKVHEGVVRAQGANSAQARELAEAIEQMSRAAGQSAASSDAAGKAAKGASTEGFQKLTNNINLFQGALGQVNPMVGAMAAGLGGVTAGAALAVNALALLVGHLISLALAKKQIVVISKEEITTNQLLADSYARIAASSSGVSESTLAFAAAAKGVAEAGLAVNMVSLAASQQQVEKTANELSKAYRDLQLDQENNDAAMASAMGLTEAYQSRIRDLSIAFGEQKTKLAELVAGARLMRDVFGMTKDQLVDLAQKAGAAPADLDALRRALDSDVDSLNKLSEALGDAASRTFNLAGAVALLKVQMQTLPSINIDVDAAGGVPRARQRLQQEIAVLEGQGVTDRVRQAQASRSSIEGLISTMKNEAAAMARSDAEARNLFNTLVQQLSPAERELVEIIKRGASHMDAFTESARRQNDAGIQIAKEFEIAKIKAEKDGFEERRALIRFETEFRIQELRRSGQAKIDNILQLRAIQMRQLADVYDEEIKQERMNRVQRQEFLKQQRKDRIDTYRLMLQDLRDHSERERAIRKQMETELHQRFGRGTREDLQDAEIKRREEERKARARERVEGVFGRASKDAGLLAQQLDLVNGKLTDQQALLTALGASWDQFKEDWIESGAIFQSVADGISGAMEGMIANGDNFGSSMKAVFLNLVADLASYFGRLFISMGAGMLFIHPAAGAGLIAAGTALMALAGLFRGLASKQQQAAQQKGQGAGGAAGGGSGAVGTGGGAGVGGAGEANPARVLEIDEQLKKMRMLSKIFPETRMKMAALVAEREQLLAAQNVPSIRSEPEKSRRIAFSTSGADPAFPFFGASAPSESSVNFTLMLDGKETKELLAGLLEGKGVVTVDSAKGKHNKDLRKAVA